MHPDQKHCYYVSLSLKVKVKKKTQKTMPQGAINMPSIKNEQGFAELLVSTDVKYVMNDLLTITERGNKGQE